MRECRGEPSMFYEIVADPAQIIAIMFHNGWRVSLFLKWWSPPYVWAWRRLHHFWRKWYESMHKSRREYLTLESTSLWFEWHKWAPLFLKLEPTISRCRKWCEVTHKSRIYYVAIDTASFRLEVQLVTPFFPREGRLLRTCRNWCEITDKSRF